MTYSFKTRDGVKTCDPCGRDEKGFCASSGTTQSGCADGNCPWKNPEGTLEAVLARVAELQMKYGHFGVGSW